MQRLVIALVLLSSSAFARADTCGVPTSAAITSDDGSVAVRIDPGSRDEAGRAKVDCVATITKWSEKDRSYHFVRRLVLRNPRRPLTAVITNDAKFLVTFDDWCEAGQTENAIVIYDLQEGTSHAHSLESFLPASYRRTLEESISSTFWRGDVGTEWNQTVYVSAPRPITGGRPTIVIDPAKNTIKCEECDKVER
jgi:hypothetical protein